MVPPLGFEPRSRSNLELAVYKAAVFPLNYRGEKLNHGRMVLRHRIRLNSRELGSTPGFEPDYDVMSVASRLGYVPNLAGAVGFEPTSLGLESSSLRN